MLNYKVIAISICLATLSGAHAACYKNLKSFSKQTFLKRISWDDEKKSKAIDYLVTNFGAEVFSTTQFRDGSNKVLNHALSKLFEQQATTRTLLNSMKKSASSEDISDVLNYFFISSKSKVLKKDLESRLSDNQVIDTLSELVKIYGKSILDKRSSDLDVDILLSKLYTDKRNSNDLMESASSNWNEVVKSVAQESLPTPYLTFNEVLQISKFLQLDPNFNKSWNLSDLYEGEALEIFDNISSIFNKIITPKIFKNWSAYHAPIVSMKQDYSILEYLEELKILERGFEKEIQEEFFINFLFKRNLYFTSSDNIFKNWKALFQGTILQNERPFKFRDELSRKYGDIKEYLIEKRILTKKMTLSDEDIKRVLIRMAEDGVSFTYFSRNIKDSDFIRYAIRSESGHFISTSNFKSELKRKFKNIYFALEELQLPISSLRPTVFTPAMLDVAKNRFSKLGVPGTDSFMRNALIAQNVFEDMLGRRITNREMHAFANKIYPDKKVYFKVFPKHGDIVPLLNQYIKDNDWNFDLNEPNDNYWFIRNYMEGLLGRRFNSHGVARLAVYAKIDLTSFNLNPIVLGTNERYFQDLAAKDRVVQGEGKVAYTNKDGKLSYDIVDESTNPVNVLDSSETLDMISSNFPNLDQDILNDVLVAIMDNEQYTPHAIYEFYDEKIELFEIQNIFNEMMKRPELFKELFQ